MAALGAGGGGQRVGRVPKVLLGVSGCYLALDGGYMGVCIIVKTL